MPVDGYRSSVCAQLESWENIMSTPRCGCRSVSKTLPKESTSRSLFAENLLEPGTSASGGCKGPRLQVSVVLSTKSLTPSKSRGDGSRFSSRMRNRGRRTGGVPAKKRHRSTGMKSGNVASGVDGPADHHAND